MLVSLVKLHCFHLAFLARIKKQKLIAFFNVCTNSLSVHFKIWWLRFSYEQNDIFSLFPRVGDLFGIENYNGVQLIPNIN